MKIIQRIISAVLICGIAFLLFACERRHPQKRQAAASTSEGLESDPFSPTGFSPKATDEDLQQEFERDVRLKAKEWHFYQDNMYFWMILEAQAKERLMIATRPGELEVKKIEYQEAKEKTKEAAMKFDDVKDEFEELVGSARKPSQDFKALLFAHERAAEQKWDEYLNANTVEAKRSSLNELMEINKREPISPASEIQTRDPLKQK